MQHILRHELCHSRRGDLYYKWFAMAVGCLHWFNPLMYRIRRELDHACELACDEAVVEGMSPLQRQQYGETLLGLAVRSGRAPTLATTMGEEKALMKGRIMSMIAHRKRSRRTVALALVLTLLLTGCAAFLGAPGGAGGTQEQMPSVMERSALTEEELQYFNETYFNGSFEAGEDPTNEPRNTAVYPNLRNQLLIPFYDSPEEIDLFEVFYIGAGSQEEAVASREELVLVMQASGMEGAPEDAPCGCTKVSAAAMDAVLTEYLGLTLEETEKIGLDQFVYLEGYDAYYHYHGDTNYLGGVTFTHGERDEAGNVFLYYNGNRDSFDGRVLRLKEHGEGYRFLSNQKIGAYAYETLSTPALPEEVVDAAMGQAEAQYRIAKAAKPERNYVDWRVDTLNLSATEEVEGLTLEVYEIYYNYRPLAGTEAMLTAEEYITAEGWIGAYAGDLYLVFERDGETRSYLDCIVIDREEAQPGTARFSALLAEAMDYTPALTPDTSVGIELILDYADDHQVIFHGYFGLFVYDLERNQVVQAVDFVKTLGTNQINGDVAVDVVVSEGGSSVQLSLEGSWEEAVAMGLEPEAYWYLDTKKGRLSQGEKIRLEPFHNFVENDDGVKFASSRAVPFFDGDAYVTAINGSTIDSIQYIRDDMVWSIFDQYFD